MEQTSRPVRFAVIGSGWRARFFARVARAAPQALELAGVLSRHPDRAGWLAGYGLAPSGTVEEILALRPEFVAVAVAWDAAPGIVRKVAGAGVPVLVETPPAPDAPGLRALWRDVGASGLVQVGEQYARMPGHAARLALVRRGEIGRPTSVEIHSTHLYHAVALIRAFLGVGTAQAVVDARTFTAPLLDPLTPSGWVPDPRPEPRATTIATLDFGDGRVGLYDFVDNQWWNPLRARRIVVRGERGEISDDAVVRWRGEPVTSHLEYRRTGRDMNLEGNDLVHVSCDGEVLWRSPWVGSRLSEDDIAVADELAAMGQWVRGEGPEPYSLAQGCQDHLLALAIEQSAREHRDVRVPPDVWVQ